MNIENLQLMVTMLKEVEAGTWRPNQSVPYLNRVIQESLGGEGVFSLDDWIYVDSCGFTACAIGHACLDKRFNDRGLYLLLAGPFLETSPMTEHEDPKGVRNWSAVRTFFGLANGAVADRLFSSAYYAHRATAADVAERIERLIALRSEFPGMGQAIWLKEVNDSLPKPDDQDD